MPFLRILGIFGFNVGAAVVAMAIYPIIATATKPLVESLTKKKAGPKGEKQQTNTKSKEKLEGSAAGAKRQGK